MALIGHQAPGFTDFHPNPFLMSETFGVVFQHVGLTEYIATALDTVTQQEVDTDVEHVTANLKFPFKSRESGFGVEAGELGAASRHYLAMKRLVTDNNFDALAIRCWPELPGPAGLGQWPYMALARLATEGLPVACEGDVDGSLGCLVGDTHLELGASPHCAGGQAAGVRRCVPLRLAGARQHHPHPLARRHGAHPAQRGRGHQPRALHLQALQQPGGGLPGRHHQDRDPGHRVQVSRVSAHLSSVTQQRSCTGSG